MSFSDLMSSARGPGVIGTLMALAVMAIFVMFFIFAFDERFQGGGKSIQSIIAQQAQEIDFTQSGVDEGLKTQSEIPALILDNKALGRLQRENESIKSRIVALGNDIESRKAELSLNYAALENYKNQYRAVVRGKAKGELIGVLKTQKGDVYNNVNIREVTAIGIQIRHEEGQRRIPYEDLPEAMQNYYQFDVKQKVEAVAKEQAILSEHEAAVSVALNEFDQQAATKNIENLSLQRDKLAREIAMKSLEISRLANSDDRPSPSQRSLVPSSAFYDGAQLKQEVITALDAQLNRMQQRLNKFP